MVIIRLFLPAFICFLVVQAVSQEKATFSASDDLTVTADLYENNAEYPYILLFHQAEYSRGEFKETAPKIGKIGFNCLAVDLRSGDEVNYVKNETAQAAKDKNLSDTYLEAEKDILAAIDYAYEKSGREVLLLGSSYSASLCLKVAKNNPKVKAVVAFSPGEYFKPDLIVKDELKGMDKPVFAASSQREYPYLLELFTYVSSKNKTLFKPQNGKGQHGSKTLWKEYESSREYWLALLIFLKQYKG